MSTSLTTTRITRNGCFAGTRSSRSTYENNDPVTASDPRIAASIPDGDTKSDLRYPVSDDFFNSLLKLVGQGQILALDEILRRNEAAAIQTHIPPIAFMMVSEISIMRAGLQPDDVRQPRGLPSAG